MDHPDDRRDEILEEDLDEIAETGSAARRDIERIARDERNMNALLSAMATRIGNDLPAGMPVPEGAGGRRWRWWTAGSLAAAAAVAALILARGGEIGDDDGVPAPPATEAPSMIAEIDVEADGPFAVFPTDNPNIVVVWLLDLEEKE